MLLRQKDYKRVINIKRRRKATQTGNNGHSTHVQKTGEKCIIIGTMITRKFYFLMLLFVYIWFVFFYREVFVVVVISEKLLGCWFLSCIVQSLYMRKAHCNILPLGTFGVLRSYYHHHYYYYGVKVSIPRKWYYGITLGIPVYLSLDQRALEHSAFYLQRPMYLNVIRI